MSGKQNHAVTTAFLVAFMAVAFLTPSAAQSRDLGYFLPASPASLGISAFAADGVSQATTADAPPDLPPVGSAGFLGFPSKTAFHRFSGWASGGVLLAAGIVGGIHILDMMDQSHAQRGSLDDFNLATCGPILQGIYSSSTEQTLRWAHVGLLSTGEIFYLANAITGTGFMGNLEPGWNPPRIHRYAFFVHAGLMVAEAVLGFFLTDALQRSDHEAIQALGAAHATIGIVIPVVILSAGAVMGSP
jgi:hypothetical protein